MTRLNLSQPHFNWWSFGFRFLGTSGQNIDDLEKYSEAKDKLEFLERTLSWRHLAPTAPNTLGTSYFLVVFSMFWLVDKPFETIVS